MHMTGFSSRRTLLRSHQDASSYTKGQYFVFMKAFGGDEKVSRGNYYCIGAREVEGDVVFTTIPIGPNCASEASPYQSSTDFWGRCKDELTPAVNSALFNDTKIFADNIAAVMAAATSPLKKDALRSRKTHTVHDAKHPAAQEALTKLDALNEEAHFAFENRDCPALNSVVKQLGEVMKQVCGASDSMLTVGESEMASTTAISDAVQKAHTTLKRKLERANEKVTAASNELVDLKATNKTDVKALKAQIKALQQELAIAESAAPAVPKKPKPGNLASVPNSDLNTTTEAHHMLAAFVQQDKNRRSTEASIRNQEFMLTLLKNPAAVETLSGTGGPSDFFKARVGELLRCGLDTEPDTIPE